MEIPVVVVFCTNRPTDRQTDKKRCQIRILLELQAAGVQNSSPLTTEMALFLVGVTTLALANKERDAPSSTEKPLTDLFSKASTSELAS